MKPLQPYCISKGNARTNCGFNISDDVLVKASTLEYFRGDDANTTKQNKNTIIPFAHQNPLGELRKVSKFLGTNTDESFLKAVVEKCHIDRMGEDKMKHEWSRNVNLHYKKGKSGTWKELFTVEQYEYYERIYREKMAGSKFEERYKGAVNVL